MRRWSRRERLERRKTRSSEKMSRGGGNSKRSMHKSVEF
jgi:hypothetical protein